MLDSSPLHAPPPRKLKRTASAASLPSPPPSVQPPKKRANSQKFDSDPGSGSEADDAEDEEEGAVVTRKLLFSSDPSTSSLRVTTDDPFLETSSRSSMDIFSSRIDVPASPPYSKHQVSQPTRSPRTPPPIDRRGRCLPSELPTLDEDENPFIASSPPKPRRAWSPVDITEKPTLTYVFKGIKTSLPNPHYNLPESVYERARLPLYHPDYSPLPVYKPRRLFQEAEAYSNTDVEDAPLTAEGDPKVEFDGDGDELRTPDAKPRITKYFVDAAGNPLPDSGPQGVRGKTMDASEIGRMAVGPPRLCG